MEWIVTILYLNITMLGIVAVHLGFNSHVLKKTWLKDSNND